MEEERIQRRKNTVTYHIVMILKLVMINNKAITDEKLNGRKPSLFAWSFGHLTNTCDAVNFNKNSHTFTKATRTTARGSFQR